jgi:hypothetical protein
MSQKSNNIFTNYKIIFKNLSKYNKSKVEIDKFIIKCLMFHKKTHLTSIFTEYLIWDDNQEFLFELLNKKYSLVNIPLYIKFQDYKNIYPTFRDSWCRYLLKSNLKMKKILFTYLSEKTKPTSDASKNANKKYSNILPIDLSYNSLDKNDKDKYKNMKGKEYSESESTIDNLNANNDISMSLDLNINQKYDNKLLIQNCGFVKGKNEKNDRELIKILAYLKPINTIYIQNKNKQMNNKLIYLDYINNKIQRHSKGSSKKVKQKVDNKYNYQEYKNRNTISNKSKDKKNIDTNKIYKNYSKSNKKDSNSNSNAKANNNNIIILNKYNDNFNKTSSTKTNSHNNSYKNRNREMIKNNNSIKSKKINSKRNKFGETLNINQFTDNQILTPSSYEFKNSQEEENINLNINTDISIRGGSYKSGKTNKNIFIEENSGENVKKIFFYKSKRNQFSNKNDKKIDYLNKINNAKINKGKNIFENTSDMKKTKLLIIHKSHNKKNKISNKTSVKKEKSLDNQPFLNLSNKLLNNKILSKKNKNIIVLKKKVCNINNINIFH